MIHNLIMSLKLNCRLSMKRKKKLDTVGSSPETPINIGIVRGGESEEREISLKTGKAVANALQSENCTVQEYDTSPDLGSKLKQDDIEVVFLALHGKGGEDGTIQGMLEWRGIPYTGPCTRASALCMDKLRTRQVFDREGISSPDWFYLRNNENIKNKKNFQKMVVKPRFEGSSLGMSIVEENEFETAVQTARNYDSEVIVEEYIEGYEVTVGVFSDTSLVTLPPIGIRPKNEFFDFETKYTKGLTEYDVPAEISDEALNQLKTLTGKIVKIAETESLCRVDYIQDNDGNFRLLEINTIPGLTETSLLPKAAREKGISFEELIWKLITSARRRQQCQQT